MVCAGHVSRIPDAGNYFLLNQLGESVIVLKNKSGGISSFHNVCRHKGTEIFQTDGRVGNSIQCSYHGWTYDLDGKLIGAPSMEDTPGFKKEDYPLKKAQVHIWNGFIFVNLSLKNPVPFNQKFPGLTNGLTKWNMEGLKSHSKIYYEVNANWKLIMENFNECYHCATLHPALNKLADNSSGHNNLTQGPALGGYMDFLPGIQSMTMTGRSCALPVGELGGEDLRRGYYYSILPNMLLNVHPDYVMFHLLTPTGPNKTKVVSEWLFNPESFGRPEFNPDDAIEFWDVTNKQDWDVCERGQRGIGSHAYEPGPYSARESLLAAFDKHYLDLMR